MTESRVITREEQEFTGAILTAMVDQSADIANRLDQNRLATIEAWKKRYAMLYHSMEKVAARTDSATAYAALDRFSDVMEMAEEGKTEY